MLKLPSDRSVFLTRLSSSPILAPSSVLVRAYISGFTFSLSAPGWKNGVRYLVDPISRAGVPGTSGDHRCPPLDTTAGALAPMASDTALVSNSAFLAFLLTGLWYQVRPLLYLTRSTVCVDSLSGL